MASEQRILRFAPSPTGNIHIGNARTAVLNWLYAKADNGRFILRFDDTDPERSKQCYADAIVRDLSWLNITPDDILYQSKRDALYATAAERLRAAGKLYPCYETSEELDRQRGLLRARGKPPIYDRSALTLSEEARQQLEASGRRPHWRFLLARHEVTWEDLIRGPQHINTASLSDPVLIREDGSYLYTLPSVVDDIDLNISCIIRGEDHVTNTAVQIELFEALGASVPAFAHHALLVDAEGEALSKRSGALSLQSQRATNIEGMTVASLAATIGTTMPLAVYPTMAQLITAFAAHGLSCLSRAPGRFDPADLMQLNAKLLHQIDYSVVADHLRTIKADGGEAFWQAIRGNITTITEASEWWAILSEPLPPAQPMADWLPLAAELLPTELVEESWRSWTKAISARLGIKGRALYMPLRVALTGRSDGPELKELLPLMDRQMVIDRLVSTPDVLNLQTL